MKPCRVCGETPTIGVGYGAGEFEEAETKFFCREHVPAEFDEDKIKARWRRAGR
jgi:hypothetical protein